MVTKKVPRFMPNKVADRWSVWDTVDHEFYDDNIPKKEDAVALCERLNEKYDIANTNNQLKTRWKNL